MKITLNGDARAVPDGLSIRGLLDHLQIHAPRVAVEVNRQVVPRDHHQQHLITDGDRVEVVTFVGGG